MGLYHAVRVACEGPTVFTLELDLHLYYVPPMHERGGGICLTRTLELPFAPSKDIRVFSKTMDEVWDPMGWTLNDVVWDMDRRVFLAHTDLIHQELPMAFIPDDVRAWIGRGWKLGSFMDSYPEPEIDDEEPEEPDDEAAIGQEEETKFEIMHTLPPRRRTKEFNRLFKAMIRHMAETYNASDVSYAMDKLGRFITEYKHDPRAWNQPPETPDQRKWSEAVNAYSTMSIDEQIAWRERVLRYPSLKSIISQTESTDGR